MNDVQELKSTDIVNWSWNCGHRRQRMRNGKCQRSEMDWIDGDIFILYYYWFRQSPPAAIQCAITLYYNEPYVLDLILCHILGGEWQKQGMRKVKSGRQSVPIWTSIKSKSNLTENKFSSPQVNFSFLSNLPFLIFGHYNTVFEWASNANWKQKMKMMWHLICCTDDESRLVNHETLHSSECLCTQFIKYLWLRAVLQYVCGTYWHIFHLCAQYNRCSKNFDA